MPDIIHVWTDDPVSCAATLKGEKFKDVKKVEFVFNEDGKEIGRAEAKLDAASGKAEGKWEKAKGPDKPALVRKLHYHVELDGKPLTNFPEEIHVWATRGRALGCMEALMCLGDKPELAYPSYRTLLADLGHRTTAEYVFQACEIALNGGLLPHTNAGLLTADEMTRLKAVNVSLGLMLENVSPRLRGRGQVHQWAPDKEPALRLRMLREAGELQIPFTTGLLIGIGETLAERVETLVAIRDLHRTYGHIQEVIVQNFRAKPTIRAADLAEPSATDLARTVAIARLILDPEVSVQAPPNLSPADHALLLAAGLNDWGGISPLTPDYVNPEAPWPHVAALAATCRAAGYTLRERLAIYPAYIDRPGYLAPALRARVQALVATDGGGPMGESLSEGHP